MDLKQLWLNTQDLWGALDQHPLLHSSLALMVLLVIALLLGRVASPVPRRKPHSPAGKTTDVDAPASTRVLFRV